MLAALLFVGCFGGFGCESAADSSPWDIRENTGEDAGVTGADSGEEPDGCIADERPRCEGGNLYEETTGAGCTTYRCYCADWAYYHEASGKCVDAISPRRDGRPCEEDSECESGHCDRRYLGSEEYGICMSTCDVRSPDEECPDDTYCHVPGDYAGYCLPECKCDGGECSPDRSCAEDEGE